MPEWLRTGSHRSPTTPIRVVHLITKMAIGGAQESALATCAGLDASRFRQVLISGGEVDSEGTLFDDARSKGVEVVVEDALVRRVNPVKDLLATWRLARRFRKWKPDIVHTHSSKAGLLGRIAARAAGVPCVVHSVHGWSFHDDMSRGGRAAIVLVERAAARLSDALIVESSTDLPKGLSRRIGQARQYALIRNGIDLSMFRPAQPDAEAVRSLGLPPSSRIVGTVGRLADQKDPVLMVEAFAKVARAVPDVHFVWIGDGPLRATTEARIAQLGLIGRFHIVGVRRDVHNLLTTFSVFALSSRWEGLPRTITEAMASGVPVVATRVDGTAEAVTHDHSGLLVASGDPDSLADAIVALLVDRDRAARLAHAALERADIFSLEVMTSDLAALYGRLLEGGRVLPSKRPLRVLHVITGLGFGGAERQLQGLLLATDQRQVVHEVISLTDIGPIGEQLTANGVQVRALGMTGRRPSPRSLLRLRRLISRSGADLVQTWLYHSDLLGGVVARCAGIPVVWNVRMSWMDAASTKSTTMAAARWCARLSQAVPQRIIFNSVAGLESHRRAGYYVDRAVVLENGIDLERFRPSGRARQCLLNLLGGADIGDGAPIVGVVARSDPQKGHDVLLQAFAKLLRSRPDAHLVLIGRGCGPKDDPLSSMVRRTAADRIHLLGPRSDVGCLTPAFDVAVSASTHGESFSNAIIEALACGVPVVATDVGAAKAIIGDAGRVVVPGSAAELAAAIDGLIERADEARRAAHLARPRLESRSFERMGRQYLDLYSEVLGL